MRGARFGARPAGDGAAGAASRRGRFTAFPYIGEFGCSDVEFCRALLLEEQVAIIPGSAFGPGGAGYARICYAAEHAKIEEALRRMARFLARLRTERE